VVAFLARQRTESVLQRQLARTARFLGSIFGSSAVVLAQSANVDPWLCVPAFRGVCLYRYRYIINDTRGFVKKSKAMIAQQFAAILSVAHAEGFVGEKGVNLT